MSKHTKIWLIIAVLLIVTGGILLSATLVGAHRSSSNEFEEKVYTIDTEFENILVDAETAAVSIHLSTDTLCHITCYEDINAPIFVKAENNTLTVQEVDETAWYAHIGIRLTHPRIEISVPRKALNSLDIRTSTGDIVLNNHTMNSLALSATTGDIRLNDVICQGNAQIQLSTGSVNLSNVVCQEFTTEGSTGDVRLSNTVILGLLSIRRSTGSIHLEKSDGGEIFIKTSTGDITCSLLTDKVYTARTNTGHINVPKTTGSGKCEVTTNTGDIKITVHSQTH